MNHKKRALSFDKIVSLYNDVRPGYPKEVYGFVNEHKKFTATSRILEVGAGNGVATKEIHDYWQPNITAIEPGINLGGCIKTRFADVSETEIVTCTFEEFTSNTMYDGLFSATAFHWVDPSLKYEKAFRLLKDDGIAVLYWNNYLIADRKLNSKVQYIHKNYWPMSNDIDYYKAQTKRIQSRKHELETSGYFTLVGHKIIEWQALYEPERYINLLRTFSDHSNGEDSLMNCFYQDILEVVKQHGSGVEINICVNVEIGKKNLALR